MARVENLTLEKAKKREKKWRDVELTVAAIGLIGLFIPADRFPEHIKVKAEIGLGIAEGFINWRRAHWSRQVQILHEGGTPTEADPTTLFDHIVGARNRHASRKDLAGQIRAANPHLAL